jgi:hypothetical protein
MYKKNAVLILHGTISFIKPYQGEAFLPLNQSMMTQSLIRPPLSLGTCMPPNLHSHLLISHADYTSFVHIYKCNIFTMQNALRDDCLTAWAAHWESMAARAVSCHGCPSN